jgi:hypothetical protein
MPNKQISRIRPIFKYFNVFILLFSILAVELIIRWNNILDVYTIRSTGQIIPFIIGFGGLLKVVMSISVRIIDDSVVRRRHCSRYAILTVALCSGVPTMKPSECQMVHGLDSKRLHQQGGGLFLESNLAIIIYRFISTFSSTSCLCTAVLATFPVIAATPTSFMNSKLKTVL